MWKFWSDIAHDLSRRVNVHLDLDVTVGPTPWRHGGAHPLTSWRGPPLDVTEGPTPWRHGRAHSLTSWQGPPLDVMAGPTPWRHGRAHSLTSRRGPPLDVTAGPPLDVTAGPTPLTSWRGPPLDVKVVVMVSLAGSPPRCYGADETLEVPWSVMDLKTHLCLSRNMVHYGKWWILVCV